MSYEAVAERYAQAIFDLGIETSSLSGLVQDIRRVAVAYETSPEMRVLLDNPLVPEGQRLAAIAELGSALGLSPLARNAVGLLARRRRLAALPGIAAQLARMEDERAGVVRAFVTSAVPLADTYVDRLQRKLEALTGKRVVLVRNVDPELLAGVIVRLGDRVIDGSARASLMGLRSQLMSA